MSKNHNNINDNHADNKENNENTLLDVDSISTKILV